MEFACFPVEAGTVPIEDAVGGVAVLLDFHDEVALADGVEASARNEDAVTFVRGQHVEAVFHRAAGEFFFEGCARGARGQSGVDAAARIAGQKIPDLGFGFASELWGDVGRRVHLHGKAIAGIEEFAKQRETRAGLRVARSENFGPVVGPKFVERLAAEQSVGDDALCFLAVDHFPGLADRLAAGEGTAEARREFAAAPDAFLVEGNEGNGIHGIDGFSAV